jgi:hypothetical protein
MKPRDDEFRLRAAFAERLAAAPPPPDAMFARVQAALGTSNAPSATTLPARQSGALPITRIVPAYDNGTAPYLRRDQWLAILGAGARLVTATAIVAIFGTLSLGTIRLPRAIGAATTGDAQTEVTFEGSLPRAATIARSGSLSLTVGDVAQAARHIGTIVQRENGAVIARAGDLTSATPVRAPALRLVLRVPADRLDATIRAIGALGSVRAQTIANRDLSAIVAANARQLLYARDHERVLEAAGIPPQRAAAQSHAARLSAQADELDARVASATLAVILHSAPGEKAGEPSIGCARRTSTSLARRLTDAAPGTVEADKRAGVLAAAAPDTFTAAPALAAAGAATGRNGRPARV